MSERETHDFMSVDSFAQLPFMRRERPPNPPPIRLFGFDFPPEPSTASDTDKGRCSTLTPADGGNAAEAIRRFECNYCFRNFPTSQALGGHQNAHKRERQQAKRSSMAAAAAEGHLQGLLGYHGQAVPTSPQPHYPSWSFSSGGGGGGVRFYSGLGSVAQPFNGSPMSSLWSNLPAAATNHHQHHFTVEAPPPSFALLRGDQERKAASTALLPTGRYDNESKNGISLDLHL